MIFVIEVRDGKPIISDNMKKLIANAFAQFNGKETHVEIREKVNIRTLKQNNYLWGVVYQIISAETGHTPEELHDIFKSMFLGRKFVEIGGVEMSVTKTTKTLSTSEFNEFVDRIIDFAGTMSIAIPSPEEGYLS